jgi:V8-like Glu-specific endopeptidase
MSIKAVLLFSSLIAAHSLYAKSIDFSDTGLIYGNDDRYEINDYSDQKFIDKGESVAIRINARKLNEDRDDTNLINFPFRKLKSVIPQLCSTERFAEQVSVGDCTGFLIAPDKLVTAGHCMENTSECAGNKWVFGFKEGSKTFKKSDVYSCKKIIAQKNIYSKWEVNDYAVIQLDRKVEGRKPLAYRKHGFISRGTPLLVIGHPLGLPMKITDGAEVSRMNDIERQQTLDSMFLRRNYFTANLDSYGGNSGSPVFNKETGNVEGILVQGADDFEFNSETLCLQSKHLSNNYINTYEKVMRIDRVPGL